MLSFVVILGLAFEVLATIVGTAGKQLVSYSARGEKPPKQRKLLKVSGLVATTLIGPILDMTAYSLAPQSIVAPLNGLDIVWNTCSAPYTLGERLTKRHVLGTALVVIGAASSSALGPHEDQYEDLAWLETIFFSWRFGGYMIIFLACLACSAAVLMSRPKGSGGRARGIALGLTAGGVAGQMFFIASALGLVRSSFQSGDWSAFTSWLPYVIVLCGIGCAIGNVPFMAKGLEEYEALFMVTLFEGCHIAVACISGVVVLREMDGVDATRVSLYWLCILSIIAGLLVIQSTSVRSLEKPISHVPLKEHEMDYLSEGGSMRDVVSTSMMEPGNGPDEDEIDHLTVVWAGAGSGVGLSVMTQVEDDGTESEDSSNVE